MNRLEKMTFVSCSLLIFFLMIFGLFFSEPLESLGTTAKSVLSILERWRLSYNTFIRNTRRASQLNDEEFERIINTSYTPIYKREYEVLKKYMDISEQMDSSSSIHTAALINTYGTRDSEILRIASNEPIPQKGFLVSPSISTVIGKIISSNGRSAEVLPVWSEHFNAQVIVKSKDNHTQYQDLALIENKQVINFNPAFPYQVGDGINISEYEPGGYTLSMNSWARIGKISAVKQNEIVEKYAIEYDYTREEILKERYFYIVE